MATLRKFAIRTTAGWNSMTAGEQAVYEGYYTTVTLFMAAIPADISLSTGTDERWEAVGYEDWGTAGLLDPVTFDNFVGEWPDNVVCLRGHASTFHQGDLSKGFIIGLDETKKWNSCLYAGANAGPFIAEDFVVLHNATTVNANIACIMGATTASTYKRFSRILASSLNKREIFYRIKEVDVLQCLAENGTIGFIGYAWHTGEFFRVRGSVAANCDNGFGQPAGNVPTEFENNVAYNCTTDFVEQGTITGSNNAGKEVVTLGIGTITSVTSADFVDAANNDFHLASGSQLDGAGADVSLFYTVDIDDDAITAPYSIGFDAIVAAGNALTAASAAVSTAAAAVSVSLPLSAVTAGVSLTNGQLSANVQVNALALSVAIASASLTADAAPTELAATAANASTANASLLLQATVSSAALASALAQADLNTGQGLSALAQSVSRGYGVLTMDVPVTGQASAYVSAVGNLYSAVAVSASTAAVSTATGGLTVAVSLSAAALAEALANAGLSAVNNSGLSAVADNQALASASLMLQIPLSANAVAEAGAAGLLSQGLDSIPFSERWAVVANRRRFLSTANSRRLSVCA